MNESSNLHILNLKMRFFLQLRYLECNYSVRWNENMMKSDEKQRLGTEIDISEKAFSACNDLLLLEEL